MGGVQGNAEALVGDGKVLQTMGALTGDEKSFKDKSIKGQLSLNDDGKVLNVDGEALKGDSKALFKGQCGGIKCDDGALKGDREVLNGNEE